MVDHNTKWVPPSLIIFLLFVCFYLSK